MAILTGAAEPIGSKSGLSGIAKRPVPGAVHIGPLGLVGDVICDLHNHGGVDQAVYLFTKPDYDWWSGNLGRDLAPGTFGENLVLDDLESASLRVGDRLTIGDAVLEVTSPRIPCDTLNARMADRTFGKRFIHACRPGFYARVLQSGPVAPGNWVSLASWTGEAVTMRELFIDYPYRSPTPEFVARCMAAPIHHKLREQFAAVGGNKVV